MWNDLEGNLIERGHIGARNTNGNCAGIHRNPKIAQYKGSSTVLTRGMYVNPNVSTFSEIANDCINS